MAPREVKVALERHRYRQVPCAASGRLLANPLSEGDQSGCFRAPQSEMTVSLYFRGVGAQRRLAVASFRDLSSPDGSAATRLTRSRQFAEMMSRHLGQPSETRDGDGYRTLYWRRPGGDPDQPDMIATSIGSSFGRNAELTSMWAYRDPSSAN